MRTIILLAVLGVCVSAYNTAFDRVNVEDVLKNKRLLKRYVDCLLGVPKTCTKDGQLLKDTLPNALKTKCEDCSEPQRKGAKRVANYLIDCKPKWWSDLAKIYDSDGIYTKQYHDELLAEGINIDGSSKDTEHKTQCYN
uniref:Chemosensory protein 10 n=1 Tax=Colaphellus bowringi TaxID=561076 RepID=A0A0S3J2K0_9CUCU|nr:chemosensory protein 10 [Colaphellus bowringi]